MKVHLRMVGCRLNQSEIEMMVRQFHRAGHEIVDDPAVADRFVVNSCAVTNEAAKKSRQLIRELHRANPHAETIVTGCYAQLAPQEIAALPGVVRVVDNQAKNRLASEVAGQAAASFDREPVDRDTLPGALGRTRAFVKVQDGCDNSCTFCVTTIARGPGRSRPQAEIVEEIQHVHAAGHQEIVLTGVHLGSYGHDWGDRDGLLKLVRAILSGTGIPRVRLSSLEPWDLTDEFFALWADARLCRHLHLPLQSGCDSTLKRMLRHTNQAHFGRLIQTARERIPDLSITTDVIVGFPGETDEEFAISTAFIEQMAFTRLHVFRYSKRPGTPAARMRGQVPGAVKKDRSAQLLALSEQMSRAFAGRFVGRTLPVLWEQVAAVTEDGFVNIGYTDNYLRARCVHPRVLTNHITPAVIACYDEAVDQLQATPVLAENGVTQGWMTPERNSRTP